MHARNAMQLKKVYIYPTLCPIAVEETFGGRDRQHRGAGSKNREENRVARKLCSLDDQQLLDVLAGGALGHAVPGGVGKDTADGPHGGYGSLGSS